MVTVYGHKSALTICAHYLRSRSELTIYNVRSRSALTLYGHDLRSQSALTIYGQNLRSRYGQGSRFALTIWATLTVCAHDLALTL